MSTELLEPVVNDGVRLTHFFNGRVLTAEDLRREQDAVRDRHRGLAGAVGEGVVRGLEVTPVSRALPAPTVRITAGLAFNRDGDPVDLPRDVELRLIPAQAEADQEAGLFAVCERAAEVSVITNPGFYLLAARPASALSRDQVPLVDVSASGIGSRCGSRYAELGASFSLIPFPVPAGGADAPLARRLTRIAAEAAPLVERVRGRETGAVERELAMALSKLRNGMAYWCAGRDAAGPRVVSLAPGAAAPVATPLEGLRASGALASCDVPLALLYVTRRQLEWVDVWSVRRAPVPRLGPDPLPLAGPLPAAEAAAAFMQFRDHAASFLDAGTPMPAGQVKASDWFLFLPPAGVLPLPSGARAGFSAAAFFGGGRPVNGPAPLDAARIPPLLRASLEHAPLDAADEGGRVWLYSVAGLDAPGSPPCILFSGYPVEQERTVLPVRIHQVLAEDPVREGDPMRLRGENFQKESGAHQVLVGGAPVTEFSLEADDELHFTVPSVAGLPPEGRRVLLIVTNRTTAAIHPLMLLPRVGKPVGEVDVEFVMAHPGVLHPGERALFRFSVRNRTDRAGPMKLALDVSQRSWPLEIVPGAQATEVLPDGIIGLAAGEERTVFVRIPAIPSGTTATTFNVRLLANFGGVLGASDSHEFTVAGTATAPDPGISAFSLAGANPAGALQGSPTARIINVSAYFGVQAIFDLVVTQAGDYVATAAFVDADGEAVTPEGWSMGILGNDADLPHQRTFAVTAEQLGRNSNQVTLPLQVQFNTFFFNNPGETVRVRVQVQRANRKERDVTFTVQRTGWVWYYGYGY